MRGEVRKAVIGQDEAVDSLLIGLVTGGHVLLEGVPGTAKTLMARSLAFALDVSFKRIQFSPDLMPADVVGTTVYDVERHSFDLRRGPVFANLVLADEINRTPPKTQSALLEAMQEGQVTIDGTPHPLPQPFMVVATQNPVEYEGTYPLPEAQLDRFQQKVVLDYPDGGGGVRDPSPAPVGTRDDGPAAIRHVDRSRQRPTCLRRAPRWTRVTVDDGVVGYVAAIVRATREHASVVLGASPRAGVSLLVASKAHALLGGRAFVTPDDVKAMTPRCLRHRVLLRPEVEIEGLGSDSVLRDVMDGVAVPR